MPKDTAIQVGYRVQNLKPQGQEQGQLVGGPGHSLGCLAASNLFLPPHMVMVLGWITCSLHAYKLTSPLF